MSKAYADFVPEFSRLIRHQRLDEFASLLRQREWDEVPLFHRYASVSFLDSLGIFEKSRILVVAAIEHLKKIIASATFKGSDDIIAMISITNWSDLHDPSLEGIKPNFWICTNLQRDLGNFSLREGVTKEADLVRDWLVPSGLINSHVVLEEPGVKSDDELFRVFVAQLGDTRLAPYLRHPV